MLRPALAADAAAICAIYNPYVLESCISFEETAVSHEQMALRIQTVLDAGLPWLVWEQQGKLSAYAYATPWRTRPAYRHSVEISVYAARESAGQGLGSALYQALFAQLQQLGIHNVIAGIALPNPASIALHEKMGMHQVARFSEVGQKFGQWHDVGYWEKLFTRS